MCLKLLIFPVISTSSHLLLIIFELLLKITEIPDENKELLGCFCVYLIGRTIYGLTLFILMKSDLTVCKNRTYCRVSRIKSSDKPQNFKNIYFGAVL
jgi:hypothetical protein